ncbi:hypothetical protein EV356DRAFT_161994 [Viridothelium virens]|uniref:Zn(2)-C6 fungal-type domain-containing protein n=1 Tax=Viridothelium virens TaxID=1048519 RepID=A0A6A6HMN7_VIRVR|nr:hypothetical protein EV356DRAFT_161994 [Viridothelium virens]
METPIAKRKRKAFSCYDCRRRKLKCDREHPACSRCRKAGHADTCRYGSGSNDEDEEDDNDNENEEQTVTPGTAQIHSARASLAPKTGKPILNGTSDRSNGQTKRIAQLEHRLAMLEGKSTAPAPMTGRVEPNIPSNPVSSADTKTADSTKREFMSMLRGRADQESMIFRKKGFKTQYYGSSHLATLLVHFPETRAFMKDAINKYPSLYRLQNDFRALKSKRKSKTVEPNISTHDTDLLALLPDQETVHHYLKYYFQTLDTMYHVLHGPSFWEEYTDFWKDPTRGRSGFIVIMILAIAAVRCAAAQETINYTIDSSVPREQAIHWTKVCEHWLERQSKKHLNLTVFQCHCLLIVAKRMNNIKIKETWTDTGTLLRFAMSAGFHREPSLLRGRASVFEQEMRRRLWATIMELELQASLERGMPSALSGFSFDCVPPLNLKDEDLTDKSEIPLPSEPCENFTPSAFLHAVQRSLSLRTGLTSQINDLGAQISFEDVLRFDESLHQELEAIPDWKDHTNGSENSTCPPSKLAKALFDITLRQYLLLIHNPFARRTDKNPRTAYSRVACFDAASRIIDQHADIAGSGHIVMMLGRDDVFSAAFTVCHHAYLSQIHNDMVLQHHTSTVVSLVERGLSMMEEVLVRLGKKSLPCWIVAMALSMVQSVISNDSTINYEQQAVERVIALNYRILASQESAPWDQNIPNVVTPSATGTNGSWGGSENVPTPAADMSFEWINQVDMSNWLPDNLWSLDGADAQNDLSWM